MAKSGKAYPSAKLVAADMAKKYSKDIVTIVMRMPFNTK